MQLKQNADVLTADAREVGHLSRVVVNPETKEVTHIVVRQGLLFVEDRVVPIGYVQEATGDRVTLRYVAEDLQTLPPLEERQDVLADKGPAPLKTMVSPMEVAPGLGGILDDFRTPAGQQFTTRLEQNIPDETIALKEAVKVVTADGRHAGSVESIAAEPRTRQITHLQITKGLVSKEKRLIPITWVVLLCEDRVHLSVDQKTLEAVSLLPTGAPGV